MESNNKKWYVINSISGAEKKVRDEILDSITRHNLKEFVDEVLVPSVQFETLKRGKQVRMERNILPGYVLIKMILHPTVLKIITEVPKVSGFLGGRNEPTPIADKDVQEMLSLQDKVSSTDANEYAFEIGEVIKVIEGPFESLCGNIEEVDLTKQKIKVSIPVFGRSTPIDFSFKQVVKIER